MTFKLILLAIVAVTVVMSHHNIRKRDSPWIQAGDDIPGQFVAIVKPTKQGTGKMDGQQLEQKVDAVIDRLKKEFGVNTIRKRLTAGIAMLVLVGDPADVHEAATNIGDLTSVEPNKHVGASVSDCTVQNTSGDMWALDRLDQHGPITNYWSGEYRYPPATSEDDPVEVYIMDTGIYLEHELFEGRAVWGYTTQDMPDGIIPPNEDDNGHGTHVAGIVGSSLYGVAKNVTMIAVKVLDHRSWGTVAGVVDGLYWALDDHNNKNDELDTCFMGEKKPGKCHKCVVQMSIDQVGYSSAYDEVVKAMVEKGMVVVVSAGNNEHDACLNSPAMVEEAITVGATTWEDKILWYSNYGKCVDVFAPGEYIKSTMIGSPNSTAVWSGTSMAAPHVSGVIANYLRTSTKPVTKKTVQRWLKKEGTIRNMIQFDTCPKNCSPNRLIYQPC